LGYSVTAALEARGAGFGAKLADQIEPRHLAEGCPVARRRHRLLAHFGDHADDDGLAHHQAHVFADGGMFAGHARVKLDGGL
jgi:GNAT superfamily N-acetyltransferase